MRNINRCSLAVFRHATSVLWVKNAFCLRTFAEHTLFPSGSDATRSWSIGRLPGNNLVLPYPRISSLHCSLRASAGIGLVLTDFSSNGTWVNHILVGKGNSQVLRNGDKISLPLETLQSRAEFIYHRVEGVFPPNSIWSKYEKETKLGKGAFGSVYKCMERATGISYAVKIIDGRRFDLAPSMKRLIRREIEIMTDLNSRNDRIVQLKESFEHSQTIYLVLEYVGGGDLFHRLCRLPALSEKESRDIISQICEGVSFIHERGVTHRDLKPENILLTTDEPPKVKIADFGLGKLANQETFLKTKCGTLDYLAPEVLQYDNAVYSNKVDSWSVGAISMRMLTGKFPYTWNVSPSIDLWHSASKRMRNWECFSTLQLNFMPDCVDFVRRLLVEDPRQRTSIREIMTHRWLAPEEMMTSTAVSSSPPVLNIKRHSEEGDSLMLMPGAYPKTIVKK